MVTYTRVSNLLTHLVTPTHTCCCAPGDLLPHLITHTCCCAPGDLLLATAVRGEQAVRWHAEGDPVLAACCHLSVDDVEGALRMLVRGFRV